MKCLYNYGLYEFDMKVNNVFKIDSASQLGDMLQ